MYLGIVRREVIISLRKFEAMPARKKILSMCVVTIPPLHNGRVFFRQKAPTDHKSKLLPPFEKKSSYSMLTILNHLMS